MHTWSLAPDILPSHTTHVSRPAQAPQRQGCLEAEDLKNSTKARPDADQHSSLPDPSGMAGMAVHSPNPAGQKID